MIYHNRSKFRGILPPLVTPLVSRKLDEKGLEKLIEHTLSGGVHGLFLLGSTGEGPGLSQSLKIDLVRRTCAQVSGRVPILVAITDTVLEDSLDLAEASAKAGADAVVVAPPYYLPPGQAEFLSFLDFMLPRLPLPLFLYNMPSMTKVHLSAATIAEAITRAGIAGLKDSSGDMNLFHELLRVRGEKDLLLFIGSETLLGGAILFGADGGVCGGANVNPGLFVDMFQAASEKNFESVVALQAELQRFARSTGTATTPPAASSAPFPFWGFAGMRWPHPSKRSPRRNASRCDAIWKRWDSFTQDPAGTMRRKSWNDIPCTPPGSSFPSCSGWPFARA
jgi:4-hydroxy-tetrahydrodipicolinate synthase